MIYVVLTTNAFERNLTHFSFLSLIIFLSIFLGGRGVNEANFGCENARTTFLLFEKNKKRFFDYVKKIFLCHTAVFPFNLPACFTRAFIMLCVDIYVGFIIIYSSPYDEYVIKLLNNALIYVWSLSIKNYISYNWDVLWCAVRWKALLFREIIKDDELMISNDYHILDDQSY